MHPSNWSEDAFSMDDDVFPPLNNTLSSIPQGAGQLIGGLRTRKRKSTQTFIKSPLLTKEGSLLTSKDVNTGNSSLNSGLSSGLTLASNRKPIDFRNVEQWIMNRDSQDGGSSSSSSSATVGNVSNKQGLARHNSDEHHDPLSSTPRITNARDHLLGQLNSGQKNEPVYASAKKPTSSRFVLRSPGSPSLRNPTPTPGGPSSRMFGLAHGGLKADEMTEYQRRSLTGLRGVCGLSTDIDMDENFDDHSHGMSNFSILNKNLVNIANPGNNTSSAPSSSGPQTTGAAPGNNNNIFATPSSGGAPSVASSAIGNLTREGSLVGNFTREGGLIGSSGNSSSNNTTPVNPNPSNPIGNLNDINADENVFMSSATSTTNFFSGKFPSSSATNFLPNSHGMMDHLSSSDTSGTTSSTTMMDTSGVDTTNAGGSSSSCTSSAAASKCSTPMVVTTPLVMTPILKNQSSISPPVLNFASINSGFNKPTSTNGSNNGNNSTNVSSGGTSGHSSTNGFNNGLNSEPSNNGTLGLSKPSINNFSFCINSDSIPSSIPSSQDFLSSSQDFLPPHKLLTPIQEGNERTPDSLSTSSKSIWAAQSGGYRSNPYSRLAKDTIHSMRSHREKSKAAKKLAKDNSKGVSYSKHVAKSLGKDKKIETKKTPKKTLEGLREGLRAKQLNNGPTTQAGDSSSEAMDHTVYTDEPQFDNGLGGNASTIAHPPLSFNYSRYSTIKREKNNEMSELFSNSLRQDMTNSALFERISSMGSSNGHDALCSSNGGYDACSEMASPNSANDDQMNDDGRNSAGGNSVNADENANSNSAETGAMNGVRASASGLRTNSLGVAPIVGMGRIDEEPKLSFDPNDLYTTGPRMPSDGSPSFLTGTGEDMTGEVCENSVNADSMNGGAENSVNGADSFLDGTSANVDANADCDNANGSSANVSSGCNSGDSACNGGGANESFNAFSDSFNGSIPTLDSPADSCGGNAGGINSTIHRTSSSHRLSFGGVGRRSLEGIVEESPLFSQENETNEVDQNPQENQNHALNSGSNTDFQMDNRAKNGTSNISGLTTTDSATGDLSACSWQNSNQEIGLRISEGNGLRISEGKSEAQSEGPTFSQDNRSQRNHRKSSDSMMSCHSRIGNLSSIPASEEDDDLHSRMGDHDAFHDGLHDALPGQESRLHHDAITPPCGYFDDRLNDGFLDSTQNLGQLNWGQVSASDNGETSIEQTVSMKRSRRETRMECDENLDHIREEEADYDGSNRVRKKTKM